MSGQTLQQYILPLAAGVQAVFNSSGLSNYRHADWLGTSRLALDVNGNLYSSYSYAPFGETYAGAGPANRSFTGQSQDVIVGQLGDYDFLFRQYTPSQGRWLVPDPAGLSAVDITNPQTWNRYAYVGSNPLSNVDPLGLQQDSGGGVVIDPPPPSPPPVPPSFWDLWGNRIQGVVNPFRFQIQPLTMPWERGDPTGSKQQ